MCFSSPSSHFSACLIRNIGEFRAKKYFKDLRAADAVQLFVPIKMKFFGSLLFKTSRSEGEFPMGYLINASPICLHALKYTLSSEQKLVYTVKPIAEQMAFVAVLSLDKSLFSAG